MKRDIFADLPPHEIVPRHIPVDRRCAECWSEDQLRPESPAMKHPAHPFGRCIVRLPGDDQCPCEGSAPTTMG